MKVYELKAELKRTDNMEKVSVDCLCDYNATQYLGDTLWEIADNHIDIYNADLLDWLKYNYSVFEDYIDEFGIDNSGGFDLIRHIQGAQGLDIYYQLSNNHDNLVLYYIYNLLYNDDDDLSDDDIEIIESVASAFADADVLPTEEEVNDAIAEEKELRSK